jgi:hypothetical protein
VRLAALLSVATRFGVRREREAPALAAIATGQGLLIAVPYFLARFAAFFVFALLAGAFLVCFFVFCDLAMFVTYIRI